MSPTNPCCTIGTKINTKAVHVTSLAECSRRYGAKKKTRFLVGTVLEVQIGPKATALGRRRTFVVAKFDPGGGDMKVANINIRSVKLHTPETPRPTTGGDGGERAAATTTNITVDTTITALVSIKVFEAPAPDPLNDEAFRVVVTQSMAETPGRPLSPLTEASGSVVEEVLDHVMDASTVEMPPPIPLPIFIQVTLPSTSLSPIPAPHTPLPQRRSPGERTTTRSHLTGEKADCCGRNVFEDH